MTEGILSRMVNCDTTTQIWKSLEVYHVPSQDQIVDVLTKAFLVLVF